MFTRWPDSLPCSVELCMPCLPGRDARVDETPISDMSALVEALVPEMAPLATAQYALFGHSTGAFIAFELAHALSELGHPPSHLFVSAQRGPSLPNPAKPIYNLPEQEFLNQVLGRYASIPKLLLEQDDLMKIVLRTLRADFTLNETYQYCERDRLNCPVTAFSGTQDANVSSAQVKLWGAETSGRFTLLGINGGHFFHQESRGELLSFIRAELGSIETR